MSPRHGSAGPHDHDDRFGRDPYLRKRQQLAARRARLDRDPAQRPPTDDDYTVEDDAGLKVVPAPQNIGELLGGLVRSRGWEERLRGGQLHERWQEIVGADLARRCRPVRLAGGTLVVRAESQLWATQLRYMTVQIRERADAVLGGAGIRELRITVGPIEG